MINYNWTNQINNLNVYNEYRNVTESFCDLYYNANYDTLRKLFIDNALITFDKHEIIGFDNFINILKQYGVHHINYGDVHVMAQPISENSLMIISNGQITYNMSCTYKFTENIILKRDDHNNFFITNTIMKLL